MWSEGRWPVAVRVSRSRRDGKAIDARPGGTHRWLGEAAALLLSAGVVGSPASGAPPDEEPSPALAAPRIEVSEPPVTTRPGADHTADSTSTAATPDAAPPPEGPTTGSTSTTMSATDAATTATLDNNRLLAGIPPVGRWGHQLGLQLYLPSRRPEGSRPGAEAFTLALSGAHGQLTRGATSELAFAAEWRFYHPAVLSPTSFGALAGVRWAPRNLFGLETPFALTGLTGLTLQNFWQDTVEPGLAFQVSQRKSPANLEMLMRAVVPIPRHWPVRAYGWLETGFQTDLLIRTDYFVTGSIVSDLDARMLNFRLLLGIGGGKVLPTSGRLFQAEAALGIDHWYNAAGADVTAPSLYLRLSWGRLIS